MSAGKHTENIIIKKGKKCKRVSRSPADFDANLRSEILDTMSIDDLQEFDAVVSQKKKRGGIFAGTLRLTKVEGFGDGVGKIDRQISPKKSKSRMTSKDKSRVDKDKNNSILRESAAIAKSPSPRREKSNRDKEKNNRDKEKNSTPVRESRVGGGAKICTPPRENGGGAAPKGDVLNGLFSQEERALMGNAKGFLGL